MFARRAAVLLVLSFVSAQYGGSGFSRIGVSAQTTTATRFDVASVKPNRSGDAESSSMVAPGGRYVATNVTVRQLVKSAYGLHDDQMAGGPEWIDKERFDVRTIESIARPEPD